MRNADSFVSADYQSTQSDERIDIPHSAFRIPHSRILVADDNADMRDYVRRLLGGRYEVVTVADGVAALEAAHAGAFDLVLTDVMMPRLDGMGLLRELRADERTKTIPVILLSARAGEEARVEGLEAMADDYLIKPFSASELLARVGARLELSRMRKQAEEALREADLRKDQFLALISHELRTPLNSILGWNRMLRNKKGADPYIARMTEVVERSGQTQLQLIEDLLDTARIVSGKMLLEVRPVELSQVIASAIETIHPAADGKGVAIIPTLDPGVGEITGDPVRLQQIVWNLLSNAVKFTPAGGRVHIELRRDPSAARIVVRDTGEGIGPDLLPYVFNRFSQNDMSRTRRHGGLGLGLALVKELVELHGGTIEAASEGAGQGATFTVTLPINESQAASFQTRAPAIAEISAGPEAIPLKNLPRLDGMRALVVDDQEEAREMIAVTLDEWGAAVTVAASGREALELLERSAFDAMVCDIAMPEMDGYEVINRLRAMEKASGQRMPAIALTALARPEDRLQAMKAGFQMHVAKPVELAELVMALASIVRSPDQEQS
jgi:signal transduction histidine kinase